MMPMKSRYAQGTCLANPLALITSYPTLSFSTVHGLTHLLPHVNLSTSITRGALRCPDLGHNRQCASNTIDIPTMLATYVL